MDQTIISRRRERWLLVLVFAILFLGYAVVWQAYLPTWRQWYHGHDWQIFLPLVFSLAAWLILSSALGKRRCRETLLLPITAFLVGIGFLFLLRLAGGTAAFDQHAGTVLFSQYRKQLLSFGVGWAMVLAMVCWWKDYRTLARYKYLIATLAVGLMVITTIFGHAVNGQTLSLNLGFTTFQPHDPAKLLLVIFLAAYLVDKRELLSFAGGRYGLLTRLDFRYLGPLVVLWVIVMAIIFVHGDLGAALLLFGSLLGVLYIGTERKMYLLIGLALSVFGAIAAFTLVRHVRTRLIIWENPWVVSNGKGYQICQGLMALGNGRVVGAGLAGGFPERIPAIHTDMIYTAISEDLGLVGAVIVVALFLILIGRIFHIGLQTRDRFGSLLTVGLAISLAVQTWVIMAGVTKLIPLTGITLPFISYGGTSLVINLLALGIALKVAEQPSMTEG